MSLKLELNTRQPDEIYQAIIDMHEGLSEQESSAVNARLILLLANHIGDVNIIRDATAIARGKRGASSEPE